jgi:hypothetical protein
MAMKQSRTRVEKRIVECNQEEPNVAGVGNETSRTLEKHLGHFEEYSLRVVLPSEKLRLQHLEPFLRDGAI